MNINHLEQALDGETPIRQKDQEQPLAITGRGNFSVTITDDARQRRDTALELARSITTANSPKESDDCIAAASLLKGLSDAAEKMRKEIAAPILADKAQLDDVVKLYRATPLKEIDRLQGLASDYQAQERRRLDIIRQEQERLNREAADAADAERRAYLAIIAKATDDQQREAAQRAADAAAEANAEAARARQQQMLATAPPKLDGASVREAMDFELLDIHALYSARPDLVTLEPKTALIKAAIAIPGTNLPGVRAFAVTKVLAKAAP